MLAKTYKRRIVDGEADLDESEQAEVSPKKESTPLDPPKPSIFSSAGHLGDMLAHPLRTIKASMSPGPEPKPVPEHEIATLADTSFTLTPSAPTSTPKTNGKTPTKASRSASKSRAKSKGRGKSKASNGEAEAEPKAETDLDKAKEMFSVHIESPEITAEEKENGSATSVQVVIQDLRPGYASKEWKEDLYCLKCGSKLD